MQVDYNKMWDFIRTNKANGNDIGTNDGVTWFICDRNRDAYKYSVHVNFNYTLSKPRLKGN